MTAGRPTLYKPEHDDQAHNQCLAGATNAGLADLFNVGERTIDRWIADIPSFAKAVHDGRAAADGQVARSLFERAVGCQRTVERIEFHRGGEEKRIITTTQNPPDTRACIFWLRNRCPSTWNVRPAPAKTEAEAEMDAEIAALDAAHARDRREAG